MLGGTTRKFGLHPWLTGIRSDVQIPFTSAHKTLDGSGYGLVGKSRFSRQVELFIRQHLNQFDFAGPAGPGRPGLGAAVFSYLSLHVAEQDWHILSRVGAGGDGLHDSKCSWEPRCLVVR